MKLGVVAAVAGLTACGGAAPSARTPPSVAEWTAARRALDALRASAPARPYVVRVGATMRNADGTIALSARGAIAVSPGVAVRAILVGPGGATAFDGWVAPSAWRVEVPALSLVRRGGAGAAPPPVGFFRWWFLAPLGGALLTADARPDGAEYLLKVDGGSARVRVTGHAGETMIRAMRRTTETREDVEWVGRSLTPSVGDTAAYLDEATGLEVEVRVEGIETEAPTPEAFLDPDEASR